MTEQDGEIEGERDFKRRGGVGQEWRGRTMKGRRKGVGEEEKGRGSFRGGKE